MNNLIIFNLNKVKSSYLYLPVLMLVLIATYLYLINAWSIDAYIQIQKEEFFFLNFKLSPYAIIQYNLTQFGDAFIILSFFTCFVIYAHKIWDALITASLISPFLCLPFKWLFKVPRPAAVLDSNDFVIIGKACLGSNSLPSGHAVTIFTVLTVLVLALMPRRTVVKIGWTTVVICMGMLVSLTRVGIGAHYPLDVIIGSVLGIISGILGILINRRYKLWSWLTYKYYFFIFIICIAVLISKIVDMHLPIFYFSLFSLFVSLLILIKKYVKN
ncbi:phosphatase PAP2 family protein [Chryseobacterium hispalense]|uniref:phosphatase PAP2 family protein n=1 Tax=Chryseobacterium hispalense TaxID=1453492 RepID=UPI0004935610|nr:phosphatase PAP2 family protein [Chryseobacterium hispalense]